jgi:hypothetical protein
VYFGYKKKTIKQLQFHNGEFKFLINNIVKIHDNNISDLTNDWNERKFELILVLYDLEPGNYNFQWVYYYLNDITAKDMKMELKWIVVDGISDAAYHCRKCESGFSKEGAIKCDVCPELFYHDDNKVFV